MNKKHIIEQEEYIIFQYKEGKCKYYFYSYMRFIASITYILHLNLDSHPIIKIIAIGLFVFTLAIMKSRLYIYLLYYAFSTVVFYLSNNDLNIYLFPQLFIPISLLIIILLIIIGYVIPAKWNDLVEEYQKIKNKELESDIINKETESIE